MTAIVFQRLRQRPLTTVACAAFAALMTGGVVNALFLQTHRHPAPLFRAAPTPAPAARQAAPVAAPAAPAAQQAAAPPATVTPPTRPADLGESVRAAEPRASDAKPKTDAIAALLRGGTAAAEQSSARTVLSAQKALAKLGYDVKTDGVMGAATRQAIERFERQHNLSVTGDLSPRNLRRLSAASGVAVD